jgi:hypothetical protein
MLSDASALPVPVCPVLLVTRPCVSHLMCCASAADMYEDMRRLEQLITEAGTAGKLSWTILLPTKLEDAPIGNRKPQVRRGPVERS